MRQTMRVAMRAGALALVVVAVSGGAQLAHAGDFEEALKIANDPALFATRAADAERLFRAAAGDPAKAKEAHFNLGLLLFRRGDVAGAREAWQKSLTADAKYLPARARLAGLELADPSKAESAAATLEAIIVEDRFQADARNLLAEYEMGRKNWDAAIKHERNVLLGDPENITAFLNVAIAYFRQGLVDQAGLIAQSALEKHPEAAPLLNLMGLVYLHNDQSRLAADSFLAALKADPMLDDARLNLAAMELAYGNFDSAFKRFDEAWKAHPANVQIAVSRGVALRGLGRFDEAEKSYLAALGNSAGNVDIIYNLCVLHHQYTQKWDQAKQRCEELLTKIDKTHPKYAEVAKRVKAIDATIRALQPKTP